MRLAPILALALGLAAALPASAKVPLADLSGYLNGLQSTKGAFTQVNADGTISTGTIYLQRPGRARFEYDAPDPALVIAGGGQVAVFDTKSNLPPEQFPLDRTPLSLILARQVDLGRSNMVVAHTGDATTTTVTAQDPAHPEYGNIQLVFTEKPVELRQWVITDEGGSQTTVILGEMQTDAQIPASLFNIPQQMRKLGLSGD